jgi:hypothetical protein
LCYCPKDIVLVLVLVLILVFGWVGRVAFVGGKNARKILVENILETEL